MTAPLDKCYNLIAERSVINFKEEHIIISTKEKIKKEALSLFAKKGYFGTSINDIASAIGLTKSSLYAHFSSKDELFFAVFEDVTGEYVKLFDRLLDGAQNMSIQDQLQYFFKEYILHIYRNPDMFYFGNQSFHLPQEFHKKVRSDYLMREEKFLQKLKDLFKEGMQQGIIRNGDPSKKVWSFKAKRDGVVGWMYASPDLNEESIEEFWNDFWFGLQESKENK